MESTHLGWRSLARRQWPLACALLFFIGVETFSEGVWWLVPGKLVVAGLAVLAPRRPFDAALAAATAVLAMSVLLRLADQPSSSPMVCQVTLSEGAALMAIIAIVVRQERVWRALSGTVLLVAVTVATQYVRPSFWERYGREIEYDGPSTQQQVFTGAVLMVLSLGTGLYFRARDRERATLVRSEVAAAQHAERMALARELHDVVAHYVTGIVVHAQAAQAVPAAAQEVLPIIAQSGTEALTAMRRLVGTLRGSETDAPAATSDLADDVRKVVRQSGQPVLLNLDLPSDVPPALARSVLRLVQESLTNSRKHAEEVSQVDVSVAVVADVVRVVVSDDGRAPKVAPVGGSGGFGLVGMRERVELLGGTFAAGRRAEGGWEVRAELPVAEAR